MVASAAFFDLDRTLLLGASGPVISSGLRAHGLIGERPIPGEQVAFTVFNLFGENLPSILLTRQGARAAKGWPVSAVRAAAADIAEPLAELVEPFATQTIEEHRAEGRKLVLATTTPFDLVTPFAERLGFDDVLATRYRVDPGAGPGDETAVYDGTIDGEFVWSYGKARSVQAWAGANRVELADSYAYSDSIFDVPMLSKVGHPVAVNPDPRLLAFATVRNWPRVWFNAPPGVPKPVGVEPQQVLTSLIRPELMPWVDMRFEGLDNIPAYGGVVLASNHRSYLDPIVVGCATAKVSRPVRFMAKKEVTDAPFFGSLATALGAIRVDRGSGSGEPLATAAGAVDGGELVAVFPQGTIPRGEAFFDPVLQGRTGAVRLASLTGAPIVPVGIWGSEKAWPRNSSKPYILNLADPPTVTLTVGKPYHPEGGDPAELTAELMARIVELLPPEAREKKRPTPEELAATFPSGADS
jgi:putative phosphoserine phosphatase/1-acylglycerol-3-phosphate O-acyltransferase